MLMAKLETVQCVFDSFASSPNLPTCSLFFYTFKNYHVSSSVIIDPPTNQSIMLGQKVTFVCSAIATFISWEVNNMPISAEQRSDGFDDSAPLVTLNQAMNLRSKNLTVLGTIKNNGSKIVCFSLLLSPQSSDRSDPVVIRVKFTGIITSMLLWRCCCCYF